MFPAKLFRTDFKNKKSHPRARYDSKEAIRIQRTEQYSPDDENVKRALK